MTRMVITGYRNVTRFSVLGVPGGSHGTLSAGTFMAQRGRSRPASSATFSAIPASSESNIGRPDRAGGSSMA